MHFNDNNPELSSSQQPLGPSLRRRRRDVGDPDLEEHPRFSSSASSQSKPSSSSSSSSLVPIPTPYEYADDDGDDLRDDFDFDRAWWVGVGLPEEKEEEKGETTRIRGKDQQPGIDDEDLRGRPTRNAAHAKTTGPLEPLRPSRPVLGSLGPFGLVASPTGVDYLPEHGDDLLFATPPTPSLSGSSSTSTSSSSTSSSTSSTMQTSLRLRSPPPPPLRNPLNLRPPTSWSPDREDQEVDEFMYKLNLGAESPYLGSAYDSGTFGFRSAWPGGVNEEKGKGLGADVAGTRSTENTDSPQGKHVKYSTHCGICLRKATSPRRTRCCQKLFCQRHIEDWLKSQESSGLCPSCDAICVLDTSYSDDNMAAIRRGSRSPSRSPRSRSSSSSSSTSSCCPSSSSSRTNSRSNTDDSTSSTLTWASSSISTNSTLVVDDEYDNKFGTETEDLWDVKAAWKKTGPGGVSSLDLVEIVRGMAGEVVGESMKFVGLSGGRTPVVMSHHGYQTQHAHEVPMKEFGGFGGWAGVMDLDGEDDDTGEMAFVKRVLSVVGLVMVLFVLFR